MNEEFEHTEETLEEERGYGEPFDVSIVAKALILFGLVILLSYLVLRYVAVTAYADDMWFVTTLTQPGALEGTIAVTCIFIFFGLIAYLIHLQFMKLAVIAEEVLAGDFSEDHLEDEVEASDVDNQS